MHTFPFSVPSGICPFNLVACTAVCTIPAVLKNLQNRNSCLILSFNLSFSMVLYLCDYSYKCCCQTLLFEYNSCVASSSSVWRWTPFPAIGQWYCTMLLFYFTLFEWLNRKCHLINHSMILSAVVLTRAPPICKHMYMEHHLSLIAVRVQWLEKEK